MATNMTMNAVVMEGDSVNAVKTRQEKGHDKPRKCYICGREGHQRSAVGGEDGGVFGDAGKTLNFWPL